MTVQFLEHPTSDQKAVQYPLRGLASNLASSCPLE